MPRYLAVMGDGEIVDFVTQDRVGPRGAMLPTGVRFRPEQALLVMRMDTVGDILKFRYGSDNDLWQKLAHIAAECVSEHARRPR